MNVKSCAHAYSSASTTPNSPRMKTDHKAIAFGLFVTALLSSTMVVAGLKAGITPGVSPLVILCAWGGLSAWFPTH